MNLNFVGNHKTDMLGDAADEIFYARDLGKLNNNVMFGDREIWRAFVEGYEPKDDWLPFLNNKPVDITLVCKWHYFNNGKYVHQLRDYFKAPVVYMVWDRCTTAHNWNWEMAKAADLYLTNEGGDIPALRADGIHAYYFPFDAGNGEYPVAVEEGHDVVFFGNYMESGDRIEYLRYIKDYCHLVIYSPRYESWRNEGIESYPPIYGADFNRVARSAKINLSFSVDDTCWGYWSNRVGRTLVAGGFLLAHYAPGMELSLKDGADYFSSKEEAVEKIQFYLANPDVLKMRQQRSEQVGWEFNGLARMTELNILLDRFLKGGLNGI